MSNEKEQEDKKVKRYSRQIGTYGEEIIRK